MSLPIPISAPSSWPRRRIQALFQMLGGGTPAKDVPEYWNGNVPWVSPKDMKTALISTTEDKISHTAVRASATQMVPAGCILIVVRSGILKHSIPVAIPQIDVALNQDMKALVPTAQCDTRFMRYIIHGHASLLLTLWRSLGATVESLDSERIKQSVFPVPPLSTQAAIANYLDEKTAAIDALIEKKRKILGLLAEERAALINQAVTKGLDPSVPMKGSGIPWIGEMPAHWHVAELRRKWLVIDCKHRTPEYVTDGYKVVSTTEIKPGRVNLENVTRFIDEADYLDMTGGGRKPEPGDIIYSRNASLGAAAFVDTLEPFSMGQDVVLIKSKDQNQLFLAQQLNSGVGVAQVDLACVGSTFKRINVAQIRMLRVCIPPLDEQNAIAEYVDEEEHRIGSLASRIVQQIERLQEYRQALITAAVTGQLDIESAA